MHTINCDKLVIASWNVNGLNRELLQDSYFVNTVNKFDCIILCETWLKTCDDFEDMYMYSIPATREYKKGRPHGGSIILIKTLLKPHIKIIESQSKCIIWLKFDKSYFNLDKNLYIGAIYIPPIESTSYTNNNKYVHYDILENEYIKYSGLGDTVILGDFNARSGHLADYIESSHHDIINNEITNNEITTYGTNCVKDRTSCDNTSNQFGRRLTDFCCQTDLKILNGRTLGDLQGNFTCFRPNGRSVVDYALANNRLLHNIKYFKIHSHSEFSDHALIELSLHVNYKLQKEIINNNGITAPLGFKWSVNSTHDFKKSLLLTTIKQQLDELKEIHDCNIYAKN